MLGLILAVLLHSRGDDLARDASVRMALWRLVADAGYGFADREEAAFVVRCGTGEMFLVRWPDTGEPYMQRWEGEFPAGTVAIVHTHPNWRPLPSRRDVATAVSAHVPVYTLTRTAIARTDQGTVEIVVDGAWGG